MKKIFYLILEWFGLIPKSETKNQPCYDKYGRFLGWFSRSMAATLVVFCKDNDGDWCVLASERGVGAADYNGLWNCPCGYLDYNESLAECAVRECFEETGVLVSLSLLDMFSYADNPLTENRQNVTMRFRAVITDRLTSDIKFSKKYNEANEVGEIKWVKLSDVGKYKWAFNHNNVIDIAASVLS